MLVSELLAPTASCPLPGLDDALRVIAIAWLFGQLLVAARA